MTKYYIVARTVEQVRRWSTEQENEHIPLKDMIVLFTERVESSDKLRGREIKPGDQLVRLGDYDRGAYWHDIEDALKIVDRNGVWG